MLTSSAHTEEKRSPPAVPGLPWLGNGLELLRDPLTFLRETHERYGNVYAIKAAHIDLVVMAGVEVNQFIAKEGRELLRSRDFWADTLTEMDCPHSFIAADGEPHRFQRMLMMPMFARSVFTGRLPELADTMCDLLERQFYEKTRVSSLFSHAVSQQIGTISQGYKPTPEEVEALAYYQLAAMNAHQLKKWPRWMLKMPRYRAAKRSVRDLAERIISLDQREGAPSSYLKTVLGKGLAERPQLFTPGDVRMHAIITFLAGVDTTSATLGFMLFELLKQPALHRRLLAEVDAAWSRGLPSADDLENMDVLQRFTKETLRLYPTTFGVRRTAVRDFTFQGYDIRGGQDILLFTTAKHTDGKYFRDPLRFDIDRYLPPRSEPSTPDALAPFGKGPHSCIGAGLARLLLPLNLGLLLRHAHVEPISNLKNIKMDFVNNPNAYLSRSFAVRLTPRERGAPH